MEKYKLGSSRVESNFAEKNMVAGLDSTLNTSQQRRKPTTS